MKSEYATAAIDPKMRIAGNQCGPPAATSLRNNHREESEVEDPEGIPATFPIVVSCVIVIALRIFNCPSPSPSRVIPRKSGARRSAPETAVKVGQHSKSVNRGAEDFPPIVGGGRRPAENQQLRPGRGGCL